MMSTIYRIESAHSHKELVQKVNGLLAAGWEVRGGIGLMFDTTTVRLYQEKYFQAMTRTRVEQSFPNKAPPRPKPDTTITTKGAGIGKHKKRKSR